MIKSAIVGATGYTGSELVSILLRHPEVEISLITSNSRAGEKFSDIHPQFLGFCDLELQKADVIDDYDIDVCILALPHRVSMDFVKKWKDKPFKIIDLSGDFRLSNAKTYEAWYNKEHVIPEMVPTVPYGLPEINRENIKGAKVVANPGCYPTTSILGLAPLFQAGKVEKDSIVIDAKSGTTGAGVKASATTHFSNVNDNFKAYGLKTHRHTVEIEENLGSLNGGEVMVQFTPHLLPVDRGILATSYARPTGKMTNKELMDLYKNYYKDEPYVRVRESAPELKFVRGTNMCDIYPTYDERTNRIIVLSVIDNLIKGAAGQAVQNMNIMLGLKETLGLEVSPIKP
ncbi:MAG: N-acetyl-gamma-glutamyl-phosphate reductase [Saprospiraceae bacterium]|nr:N-acetyl-gamma-glutamyl-phosphate reductase [Saprospiraceae bacterium]